MADITYYEDGYITQGYYVYTADAMIALGDYIEPEYIATDYFSRTGVIATLICDGTRIRYVEAEAVISSTVVVSVTAGVDRRTEVTLNSIANINSQSDRFRGHSATINGQFSLNSTATRIQPASVNFSSIAATLTVVAKNATGTVTLESQSSLTVIIGVIKQGLIGSFMGVDATTEPDATLSPYLRFGTDNTETLTDNDWRVSSSVTQTNRFIMSMWLVNPLGHVFDADPNTKMYSGFSSEERWDNNCIRVDNLSGDPYFFYYGNRGYVRWPITREPNTYSHFLLRVDTSKSTNSEKYRLFQNGQEILTQTVVQISGIGPGTYYTPQTSAYNLPITAYGQYQLMMNTTNYPNSPIDGVDYKIAPWNNNGGGYGDSGGVKASRGGLTQFWWDYDASDYPVDTAGYRQKFYNQGYVDLGIDGTQSGLSRPKHYVRLLNYQDIEEQGVKRSEQTQWQWLKLSLISTSGPQGKFQAQAYTATNDQNSANYLAGIRSIFALTAESAIVLEVTGTLTAQTQLSAQAGYRITGTVTAEAETTVTATASVQFENFLTLESTCTMSAVGYRQQQGTVSLQSTTALTCDLVRVRSAEVQFEVQSTMSALVGEITQFETQLVSTVTQSATITRIRDFTSSLLAQSTFTAVIDDRLRDQTATLLSSSTLACEAINLEGVTVPMTSTASLQIESDVVKVATAPLSLQFTQTAEGYKVAFGSATLSALMFELTQGDILNFAPELTYVVRSESRTRRVLPENRSYEIHSESRTRRVLPESRILTPDQETYVNII